MTAEGGKELLTTPAVLAAEIGIEQSTLRRFLRKRFPRSAAEHGDDWLLTPLQCDVARRHFGAEARGGNDPSLARPEIDEAGPFTRANRIDPGSEDAAWRILHGGLTGEPSVLTGRASVWTGANAAEVVTRILGNPLEGSGMSFDEKIQMQMEDADPDVVQLVAEIQFIRQLPTSGIKLRGALKMLSLEGKIAGATWELPAWLEEAFSGAVFGGGQRFNQDQWLHIGFTAHVIEGWWKLDDATRGDLLANPWTWLDFLEGIGGASAGERQMRMVMAYVAWPNYFHPIISSDDIHKIRHAYPEHLPAASGNSNAEIQRDLFVIDRALEARLGGPVNFYRAPFADPWRGTASESVEPISLPDLPEPDIDFEATAAQLAPSLHMEPSALARIGRVLQGRRQVVFYGPPGTGKTYVARKLAAAIAGTEAADAVRLVQFHPSYAYEDFFEGFRPAPTSDGPAFTLQSGPLRELAKSAKESPDQPHFLVIDEMNRGNLAKVFGELYFLLEYRDQEVRLQYSPAKGFTLPDNLYIIGTMNTTDRSIGLIDAAIRRRFAFVEFHPEVSPVEGVLERFLAERGATSEVADLLGRLNTMIGERDLRIGPSYVMRPSAFEPGGLEDIWDFDILPLLLEHFHGRKTPDEVRSEFSLAALRTPQGGAAE